MERLSSIVGTTYTKGNTWEGKIIVNDEENTFEGIVSKTLADDYHDQYISGYIDNDLMKFTIDYSGNPEAVENVHGFGEPTEEYVVTRTDNNNYVGVVNGFQTDYNEKVKVKVSNPFTIKDVQNMEINELKQIINIHREFSSAEREMLEKTLK